MALHQSVLLEEAINALAIKASGVYIDGTFGRGGHSRKILSKLGPEGRLIAFDKDPEAVAYAKTHFADDTRFSIQAGSFTQLKVLTEGLGLYGKVQGILLDLGLSSPQLDNPERGFSFMQSGPLDMRMDSEQKLSAESFVNTAAMEEMAAIFREYGEERFAGRIARAIVEAREKEPITSTAVLAEIVKQANPKWEKHKHPATRVFQAIRIYVNEELSDLDDCLQQCYGALAVGGRLAVISFHSLEDRIVKQFMRRQEEGEKLPKELPIKSSELKKTFQRIGKAIKPSELEVSQNVRSRSAVLRIGEKIS